MSDQKNWSEWEYLTSDSCRMIRTCIETGEHKWADGPHEWGEWVSDLDRSCKMIRRCLRCNREEFRYDHQWEEDICGDLHHQKCKIRGEQSTWSDCEAWCSDDYR